MKKIFFMTTILVVFLFVPFVASANVIINEIMYNLETGSDTDREWVEIINNNNTATDLTDWKLWEDGTNHKLIIFQGNAILSPSSYAIIADKPDKFLIDNPGYSGIIFDSTFSLSNDGENLVLKDKNLVTIDEVLYNSSWGASGDGRSLQKKDPNGNSNNSTNWGSGNPTPGILNNISPEEPASESEESTTEKPETPLIPTDNQSLIADAGDNIIAFTGQEIKFDGSKSSDPNGDELAYSWNMGDGKLIEQKSFTYKYNYPGTYLVTLMVYNGRNYASETITIKIQSQQITINEFLPNPSGKDEEEEWIEIYNGSDFIVDISNWQLDDTASGSTAFVFPQNTLIAPKSYLVFTRQITGIALNNDKDSVRLLFPEGIVFQEINYEKPPQGKSSARTDEGFVWNLPTPGAPNISGIAISENKNVSYQNPIKTQTVKDPSQDYAVLFQNQTENKIEGGYTTIAQPQNNTPQQENSQLAAVTPDSSKQNQNNLFLIIAVIVSAGLLVGVLLTKVLKKFP